jgi:hypothetical protein
VTMTAPSCSRATCTISAEIAEEFEDLGRAISPGEFTKLGLTIAGRALAGTTPGYSADGLAEHCDQCMDPVDRRARPWARFCSTRCEMRARRLRLWAKRISRGLCARCGKRPPVSQRRCGECLRDLAASTAKVREKLKAARMCYICRAPTAEGSTRCRTCLDAFAATQRDRLAALASARGVPQCVICGNEFERKTKGRPSLVCSEACRAQRSRDVMRRISREKREGTYQPSAMSERSKKSWATRKARLKSPASDATPEQAEAGGDPDAARDDHDRGGR